MSGVCLVRSLSCQEFVFQEFEFQEFVFQEFVFQEFVMAPNFMDTCKIILYVTFKHCNLKVFFYLLGFDSMPKYVF